MKKKKLKFSPNLNGLGVDFVRFDNAYPFQPKMRELFTAQANKVLGKYQVKKTTDRYVGFEIEYSVVDKSMSLVSEDIRNRAMVAANDGKKAKQRIVVEEVGASQIEIVSIPQVLDGKKGGLELLKDLKKTEILLAKQLAKDDAFLLRIGAYPLPIDPIKNTQNVSKYVSCPRFHQDNQRQGIDRYIGTDEAIDATNPLIPGITNAVQMNVDCLNTAEAIDIFNRAFFVSPIATVFGANAGFLQGIDTGHADLRYLAWGISHDIRSWGEVAENKCLRVGMPDDYFLDINDYLTQVLSTPFFMEDKNAFPMAIGTYWRDARLKFLEKDNGDVVLVVEFRPVATQPTVEEDFAIMMFYLGRVMYSNQTNEALLPMNYVRANKDMAMRLGKDAELYFSAKNGEGVQTLKFQDYASSELEKALKGLRKLGLDAKTRQHVEEHLNLCIEGHNPVEKFRNKTMAGGIKKAIRDLNLIVGT